MGFRLAPRTFNLVFTDPALNGLQVRVRSITVDEFMEMTGLSEDVVIGGGVTLSEKAPLNMTLLGKVAARIDSWNLEDAERAALPVSVENLRAQDLTLARAVARAYLEAVSGVSVPLDGQSASGGTSAAELSDLASASQSLAS